jgi:hypothetical protein
MAFDRDEIEKQIVEVFNREYWWVKKNEVKRLIDIAKRSYSKGILDATKAESTITYTSTDIEERFERIYDQLLKMNEIIAGINRGPKTVEDLEAETTDNPEAEKPGELNSFCRLVSTWWEDIEEKLKEQREAKEKESKKPEEEKRCGNCRFRGDTISWPDGKVWCQKLEVWTRSERGAGCAFRESKSNILIGDLPIPCPCCGSKDVRFNAKFPERDCVKYFVQCENCGLTGPLRESYREAAETWSKIEYLNGDCDE